MKTSKVCFHCKNEGLFPFCDRCMRTTKDSGIYLPKKEKKKGKYDDLPMHEQKRRIAQDKYREKADLEDLERIHRNLIKVGLSGTGVPAIDDKLYVEFGHPSTWPFLVPRVRA